MSIGDRVFASINKANESVRKKITRPLKDNPTDISIDVKYADSKRPIAAGSPLALPGANPYLPKGG